MTCKLTARAIHAKIKTRSAACTVRDHGPLVVQLVLPHYIRTNTNSPQRLRLIEVLRRSPVVRCRVHWSSILSRKRFGGCDILELFNILNVPLKPAPACYVTVYRYIPRPRTIGHMALSILLLRQYRGGRGRIALKVPFPVPQYVDTGGETRLTRLVLLKFRARIS